MIFIYLSAITVGMIVMYVLAPQFWGLYTLAMMMSVIGLIRTRRLLKTEREMKKNKEDRL
ncbi:MAG: hypothetical protein U0K47_07740 [Erysipelotrichaceae bacterium]|uniref:hypothetical protein n=1 Tax=Lactimicrobium massiliense TaxID=2161814 RepID=UPI000D55355B|nr:hypothetical protein [Lactimicrobium massiliense]MEE1334471.1 hypothetical protein [Erysipelotrichaceae bacterium]